MNLEKIGFPNKGIGDLFYASEANEIKIKLNAIVDYLNALTVTPPTPTGTTNAAPTVSLAASTTSLTAGGAVTLTAVGNDTDGTIALIEIFEGSALLGSSATSSFTYSYQNVMAGSHTVYAKATDNKGAVANSTPITITATSIVVPQNQLPTVSVTASSTSATAGGNLTLTAVANDSDGTIALLEVYQGTTLLGSANTGSYNYLWQNVQAGTYSITAKATDNLGASRTSAPITITVTASATPAANAITVTANSLNQNIINVPQTDSYNRFSVNSEATFQTDGAYLDIDVDLSTVNLHGGHGVAYTVNGGAINVITDVSNFGFQTKRIDLSAYSGTKTVRLINGVVEHTSGDTGWYTIAQFLKVTAASGSMVTQVNQPAKEWGMVVVTDSIGCGVGSNVPQRDGIWQHVKEANPTLDIYIDGWGQRQWNLTLSTPQQVADTVARAKAKLSQHSRKNVWLMLGTNDFGAGTTSLAQQQGYLTALVNALISEIPDLERIFVQTPLPRNGETQANVQGWNLPQLRTAYTDAVSSIDLVQVVNGTLLCSANDLADGVHPSNSGTQIAANNITPIITSAKPVADARLNLAGNSVLKFAAPHSDKLTICGMFTMPAQSYNTEIFAKLGSLNWHCYETAGSVEMVTNSGSGSGANPGTFNPNVPTFFCISIGGGNIDGPTGSFSMIGGVVSPFGAPDMAVNNNDITFGGREASAGAYEYLNLCHLENVSVWKRGLSYDEARAIQQANGVLGAGSAAIEYNNPDCIGYSLLRNHTGNNYDNLSNPARPFVLQK